MILLGKNANLLEIDAPAVAADPGRGIPGTPEMARWTGSADAYVDEDIMDEIKGGMRVSVSRTIVDLPANLPVWPQEEDILIIKRIGAIGGGQVPNPGGQDTTPNERLIVRTMDGGLTLLGKLRVKCVRS